MASQSCYRRLKKCCKKCWSVRFWTSRLNNKFRSQFGFFVRQSAILVYIMFDIMLVGLTILYYVIVPEVAKLTLIHIVNNYKGYIMFGGMRISLFLIGAWACCNRKVSTMRVFFFFMPFAMFCALVLASPFVSHKCDCSSFAQCNVVVAYNRAQVVNTVADEAHGTEIFMDPPRQHSVEDDGLHQVHIDVDLNWPGDNIAYYCEVCEENEISQTELFGQVCSCAGRVTNTRKSCRFYHQQGSNGHVKSWCKVRGESRKACDDNGIKLIPYEHGNVYSEELCMSDYLGIDGCDCSGTGMLAKEKGHIQDIKWELLENDKMGHTCDLWTKHDTREWCFVGFDTTCADRKEYTLTKDDLKEVSVEKIEQVSQFFSAIPCYVAEMKKAQRRCRMWRNGIRFILFLLVFGPWPAGVIIYLWLLNRCGDLFNMKEQFEVSFSSSESDEDFAVRDSVCMNMDVEEYRKTIAEKLQAGLPLDASEDDDEGMDGRGSRAPRKSRLGGSIELAELDPRPS